MPNFSHIIVGTSENPGILTSKIVPAVEKKDENSKGKSAYVAFFLKGMAFTVMGTVVQNEIKDSSLIALRDGIMGDYITQLEVMDQEVPENLTFTQALEGIRFKSLSRNVQEACGSKVKFSPWLAEVEGITPENAEAFTRELVQELINRIPETLSGKDLEGAAIREVVKNFTEAQIFSWENAEKKVRDIRAYRAAEMDRIEASINEFLNLDTEKVINKAKAYSEKNGTENGYIRLKAPKAAK